MESDLLCDCDTTMRDIALLVGAEVLALALVVVGAFGWIMYIRD